MKPKSVSGITCYVKDLKRTAEFYKTLGFEFKKRESDHATAYLNWFWIDFVSASKETKPKFKEDADSKHKGEGMYLYLSVDDVDKFYKSLLAKKLKPSSEPRDWPWGNREFVIRDPDGYKLVIFKKK